MTLTDRFNHYLDLYRARPVAKLFRMPWRFGYSAALASLSDRLGRPIRAMARTFWGGRMRVVYPDCVSAAIHRYRIHEEADTKYFLDRIKPGDVVFDVGAHFGYFTLLSRHLVGDAGQVHSFEPSASTLKVLRENTSGFKNITVNEAAVSDTEGTLELRDFGEAAPAFNSVLATGPYHDSLAKAGIAPTLRKVPAITIDAYCDRNKVAPDFIKVDAEGAGVAILAGMRNTLEKHHPTVTMETGFTDADGRGDCPAIYDALTALGYKAFEYDVATRSTVPFRGKWEGLTHDLMFVHPSRDAR